MRQTIYKIFIASQYEEEERWINEMSAKGQALVYAGLCRYIFEDEEPGKYQYKIQLLNKLPAAPESKAYLQFLEETGIEFISSILAWVYLRKKTEDGPFGLYSDIGSSIRYFKRLQIFFIVLTILEFFIGIQNLWIGIFLPTGMQVINICMGLFLLFLGMLLAAAARTHTKKLQELRKERQIRE
jgi:hypothetical protein